MKRLLAVLLTGALVLGGSVGVLAADRENVSITPYSDEDKQVVVDGNVTGGEDTTKTSVYAHGNLGEDVKVEVKGNVNSPNGSDGSAIVASGDAKVEVDGNVTGRIYSHSGGKVKVGGNVDGGIEGASGKIKVDGDVYGPVLAEGRGQVEIGGDAGSITASGGSTVNVGGNASYVQINDGFVRSGVEGNTKVKVAGDVDNLAFDLQMRTGQSSIVEGMTGTAIVEGTVKETHNGISILFGWEKTANNVEAIVYKTEGKVVELGNNGGLKDATDRVFYIVKKDSDDISLSGTIKKEGYDTAHAGDVVVITVAEGYKASSTAGTIVKNVDGTYSITIPAGGGVTISAIMAAIDEMESNNRVNASVEVSSQDDSSSKDSTNAAPVALLSDTPVLIGNVLTATLDASEMPEEQYTSQVVELISQVPTGGTMSLNVTNATFLNETIISALKARSDVSISLNVKFMGLDYSIVIPAGYDLTKLIGADGRIDFAKLLKTFGATAK